MKPELVDITKQLQLKTDGLYKFKAAGYKVVDIDEGSRKVKLYLNSFNNIDSDKDRSIKGCFIKSILERGPASTSNRKIAFLRMHDWNKQIGKWLELSEDNYGLLGVGYLGRSTMGNDALLDYQDGILREQSIGFKYIEGKIKRNETDQCFDVTEYELWEGSGVTFGADSNTIVLDVAKGLDKESYLKTLNNEMNLLIKVLREGKGTDERFYSIEGQLNVIQSKYNSLVNYEPQDVKKCTQCKDKHEPDLTTDAEKQQEKQNSEKKNLLLLNYY
jgi:HK97 family phage prohead protease